MQQPQIDQADIAALERILDMAHELMLQGPKKPGEAPPPAPEEHGEADEHGQEEPDVEVELDAAPEKAPPLEEFHFVGGAARPPERKEEDPRQKMPVSKRGGRY